jgi:NADPH:quinone reductase-like Zn-dependent oxidoreductase
MYRARRRHDKLAVMHALFYRHYGKASVLELGELPEPAIGAGEVRVRVVRAALNPKDALFRSGRFKIVSGRRFPKQCGLDVAGVVLESRTAAFAPGQRVFGCLDEWTFLRGTLAEQVACRASELTLLPERVSDEAAAAIALVGVTSLQALRDIAALGFGQRLLVHGASGGVGTAAIQIGKHLGAEVHTVSSPANEALCAELGADRTHSYPSHGWRAEPPFDVIFDVFGTLEFRDERSHLAPHGRFVTTVPSARRWVRDRVTRLFARQERLVVVRPNSADLELLASLVERGELRPVVHARHPLADFRRAFETLESKRARGKLVIEVA